MKVLVQDINPGVMIIDTKGKGLVTVKNIIELESNPPQYKIYFEGINQPGIYWYNTEFEVFSFEEET